MAARLFQQREEAVRRRDTFSCPLCAASDPDSLSCPFAVLLVFDNSTRYNPPGDKFHALGKRLERMVLRSEWLGCIPGSGKRGERDMSAG